MDDQFYRSLQPRRLVKDLAKKAAKNKRRTLILVIAMLAILYLLFDNKGIITRVQLEAKKQEMTDQVRADSVETQKLQAQIKALEGDKKTVEKLAREKYGMSKQGETVYRVKKEEQGK